MKILKKGKDMTASKCTETFVCRVCGCEFEASEDEYWVESGWITSASTIGSDTYSYTNEEKIHCNCPQCHANCSISRLLSTPTITLHSVTTSV